MNLQALKSALGPRLISVLGDGQEYILVLSEVTSETLRLVADALRKPRPNLVFFTPSELADSRDVFPVELLEAQASYRVLHGQDVLADLQVPVDALRLQIEEDLKTQRTWLRQRYLDVCHDGRRSERLAVGAFQTLPPILRAMLRYRKLRVPSTLEGQLQAAAEAFSVDRTVLASLQSGKAVDVDKYAALLEALIAAVEND